LIGCFTREKAIIKFQENEEALEMEEEQNELSNPISKLKGEKDGDGAKPKASVKVPPIPEPTPPPRLQDLEFQEQYIFEDLHPHYPPKGREQFVAHLDTSCFHIVDGRYFGLRTNSIADPHFVGPNAPGISGLNLSGGTGLATAHTGGGGSAGAAVLAVSAVSAGQTSVAAKSSVTSSKAAPKKPSGSSTTLGSNGTSHVTVGKKKSNGPTPTASSSELRRILEEGGEEAEKMRVCIIRAAVHASRSGKHGQSFRGPSGEYYPDVSKAFAAHAGLKPCIRCKNNKQGVSLARPWHQK
jgi:hypothetical protein